MSDTQQSRLPALLNGAGEPARPSPWWNRSATAAGVSAVGLITTSVAEAPAGEPWTLAGRAMMVLMNALRRPGRPPRRVYPILGRAQAAWRSAGATPHQLAFLDEAQALRTLTPRDGY